MNIIQLQICAQANEQNASVTEHAWIHKEQLPYLFSWFSPKYGENLAQLSNMFPVST